MRILLRKHIVVILLLSIVEKSRITKVFENDMKRVTLDETDAVEYRIKSAFLI